MQIQYGFNPLSISTMLSAIATSITLFYAPATLATPIPIPSGSTLSAASYSPSPSLAAPHFIAQTVTPDTSSVSAGAYSNEFFGFSMNFPTAWAIASQETRDEIMNLGTEIISSNNPELGASAAAALQNTYQLLLISESPLETPTGDFNANLLGMAERITGFSEIISGEDYLENHRALIGQTGLPYEAIGDIYPVTIGGRDFHRSDFQLGGIIQQSYIFTVDQGYAYGFILSGLPEQMVDLETIVESVQFKDI